MQTGVRGIVPGQETILSNGRPQECGPRKCFRKRAERWLGVIPMCSQWWEVAGIWRALPVQEENCTKQRVAGV